jgi:preprotein translocase subunit SecD
MKRNLGIKAAIILVVLLVFLYGIFGAPHGLSGTALVNSMLSTDEFARNGIHLGLDLKGGLHMILQVQVDDAIRADAQQAIERLKADLKSAGTAEISQPDPKAHPEVIQIKGLDPSVTGDLRTYASEHLQDYDLTSTSGAWTLTMKPSVQQAVKKNAVEQAIETIRNRIDALGVAEPIIQEHGLGDYQILVQLPGVDDPERVRQILQNTAMLDVRLTLAGPFGSEAEADQQLAQHADGVVMKGNSIGSSKTSSGEEWYILANTPAVSGRDFRPGGAQVSNSVEGRSEVTFQLTNEGGRRFYTFTSTHVGQPLAIILDNKVREVANIHEPIHDSVRITGSFSLEEAKDLRLVLNSGALPASISYREQRTVGPSLGADSIRHGVTAAIIGMTAVLIFMLVYYRAAGINADVGLILNLIILLGFLGYAGAALTLPGIAGVILTIGMGVDSNVLIFERIREELRNGKSAAAAVDQGFSHAWITIVDTHVTTIVSAIILFVFGSGPVRGFAITLLFGLLANLFTSVFVSRVIFDSALSRKQPGEALSI